MSVLKIIGFKKFAEDLQKISNSFKEVKSHVPVILGNMAKNHYLEGFRKGGYMTDASQNGWTARTTKNKSDRRNPTKNRAILVKSGILRKDIQVKEATFDRIIIGTSNLTIDYASIHNQGLMGKAWGKHVFKMPKREFIGHSKVLIDKLGKEILRQYTLNKKK